jgi:hypothetical protein
LEFIWAVAHQRTLAVEKLMFDSIDGGVFPIVFITFICGWFIPSIEPLAVRIFAAFCAPVGIALGWFFIPRILMLFKPLGPDQDPWVAWGFAAAGVWSIIAIPTSVVSVLLSVFLRRRLSRKLKL